MSEFFIKRLKLPSGKIVEIVYYQHDVEKPCTSCNGDTTAFCSECSQGWVNPTNTVCCPLCDGKGEIKDVRAG